MDRQESKNEPLLRFTAGGRAFQVPVAEVERVLSLQSQAISPIPFGLGKRALGLFSFRGVALPLIRMAGDPAGSGDGGGQGECTVILLGTGAKRFGLAVDSADSVSDAADPAALSVCAQSVYEGSVCEI